MSATSYPLMGPREPTDNAVPASVLEQNKKSPRSIDALPCPAFTPNDADPTAYLSAREDCWNRSCKQWPSVIAMPTSAQEVQTVRCRRSAQQ